MNEFIRNLEDMLELQPGTLRPNTLLTDIKGWDSMATVGFIALADGTYGKAVVPSAVRSCQAVGDLAALVGQS